MLLLLPNPGPLEPPIIEPEREGVEGCGFCMASKLFRTALMSEKGYPEGGPVSELIVERDDGSPGRVGPPGPDPDPAGNRVEATISILVELSGGLGAALRGGLGGLGFLPPPPPLPADPPSLDVDPERLMTSQLRVFSIKLSLAFCA